MRKLIVLRGCPPALAEHEGQWCSVDFDNREYSDVDLSGLPLTSVTFGPTGRFEERADGERAEVYALVTDHGRCPGCGSTLVDVVWLRDRDTHERLASVECYDCSLRCKYRVGAR